MKQTLTLLAFFSAPFFISAQSLDANAFYNKGADVYVQKGALLHIQGTMTTTNTGSLYNDGVIEIKGDINNPAPLNFQPITAPAAGDEKAIKFIGSGTQAIQGVFTGANVGFYNLVIDKASSGSVVEMQTDVNVNGSLVFGTATAGAATYTPTLGAAYTNNLNQGVIRTYNAANTDFNLYVSNGNVDAVKGYPALAINRAALLTNSYVQTRGARGVGAGGFSRNVINTGVNYVYPIGTATNGFQAVRFNFSAIGGPNTKVRGLFCDGTDNVSGYVGKTSQLCIGCGGFYPNPDNTGINVLFGTAFNANPCNPGVKQWVILEDAVKDHGYWSFEGDPGYTYSMETFPQSFTEEGLTDPSNYFETWRTLRYHTPITDNPSLSTVDWNTDLFAVSSMDDLVTYTRNAGCYNYTQPGVPGGRYTNFSHFSIRKSKSANALPVELVSLTAEPINNQFIKVSWVTAIEINNSGFQVLRSTDGVNFTNIGWVDGHNNTTITQTYSFDDVNVTAGVVYYYKLNQVDNDGHSTETYVVSASLTGSDLFAISEFMPNPAKDFSNIIINTSTEQNIDVKLFDLLGRELSVRNYNLSVGANTIYFDTQILADATYTAVITTANKVYSKKLVIAKQ